MSAEALGPGYARLAAAHQAIENAAAGVLDMARTVADLKAFGAELPAAIAVLEAAGYLDEVVDGTRWVARAFTANPMELISSGSGVDALALAGAVMTARGALNQWDEARDHL